MNENPIGMALLLIKPSSKKITWIEADRVGKCKFNKENFGRAKVFKVSGKILGKKIIKILKIKKKQLFNQNLPLKVGLKFNS